MILDNITKIMFYKKGFLVFTATETFFVRKKRWYEYWYERFVVSKFVGEGLKHQSGRTD